MKKIKTQENGAKKNGSNSQDDCLIVGVGASAGGVQALKTFFENVPADSGAAYVVILHLSPHHDSQLTEILRTVAAVPVERVTEKVRVEANRVYVVSPNESLAMSDGHIVVSPVQTVEERRAPIDIFFRTLAESHQAHAVALVLSGTGADGSMGIKRIKERFGATFVQNPREAEFSEMPRNSIATELIDEILNVAEIPGKIVEYRTNLGKVTIPNEPETGEAEERQQTALREIFTLLRVRTGHDFSNYKRPTVLRRIERCINVRSAASLPAYAAYLKENPDETTALLKDLLISVTNFFRDKEAFEYLEREVVPKILEGKKSGDAVRVWVAGCATGEEAYSLAMLFAERLSGVLDSPSVQIFATDIDEAAIAAAREGFYTLNDAADVSPERLRRFFIEEAGGYRIRRELRELILFANHNLLKDPPFSRLDLVTCRNLLIYFNHQAQERVLETFHFSLQPNAFLFLGSSESVDGAGDLFASASLEHHVHQTRQVAPRLTRSVPDTSPPLRFNQPFPVLNAHGEKKSEPLERLSFGDLHWQILEQYAPPSLIVNEHFDIVHVSETAGRFLQIAGEISANLLKLIRPELRLELSTAVYQAVQRRTNVVAENVPFQTGERTETINLVVRPIARENGDAAAENYILVIFEPSGNAPSDAEAVVAANEPIAQQLEEELMRSQTRFRQSVEQSEIQAEELKASNEELQAMNEELRSATEELETGKEELQSVNEELITVNQELKIKIEELSQSVNDFQNLMNSTDIGTIFLDRNQRVKMFTPAARQIFNLIPADDGRALADITHRLEYADLTRDVATVLGDLHSIEREVRTTDGAVFLMRITPYRTSEDRISGTIITFVNITTRKGQEDELRHLTARLERQARVFDTTLSNITDFAYIFDREGRFVYTNQPLLNLLGIGLDKVIGRNFHDLNYPEDLAARLQNQIQQVFETGEIVRDETPFTGADGAGGFYEYIFSPIKTEGGAVEAVAGSTRDTTERRRLENGLEFLADFSQSLISLTNETEIVKAFGTQISRLTNASVAAIFEINDAKNEAEIVAEWHQAENRGLNGSFNIPELVSDEFVRRMAAGETVVVRDIAADSHAKGKEQLARFGIGSFVNAPLVRNDEWTLVLGVYHEQPYNWRDDEIALLDEAANRIWAKIITIRADEEVRESESRLQKAMQIETVGVVFFNDAGELLNGSDSYLKMIGYTRQEFDERRLKTADITLPEWMPRTAQALEELKARGVFTPYEKELVRPDGARWWGLFAGARLNERESIEYVVDITGSKLSQAAMRESEERLSLIIKSVEDYAIITTDPNGTINGWNPGAQKMFGWTDSEILGRKTDVIFTSEDRASGVPIQERQTAIETGKSEDERFHLRKDGSRFYVSGIMQTLKNGKIDGFVKIARDMTDKIAAEGIRRDKEMLQKLVGAQEDERKRIARDLHDELGQLLTGLRLKLEAVRKSCEDNEKLCGKIDETQLLAKQVDAGIDFLAWELRPAALDDLGLYAALEKYVREWSHYTGITAELLGSGIQKLRFAPEAETNLYRIAQEALNNVHKHAKAKIVEVVFDRRGDSIVLIIADDGRGFDPQDKTKRDQGIGLIGMQERAALVGGNLEIESAPGNGTTIFVRVPASFAE